MRILTVTPDTYIIEMDKRELSEITGVKKHYSTEEIKLSNYYTFTMSDNKRMRHALSQIKELAVAAMEVEE